MKTVFLPSESGIYTPFKYNKLYELTNEFESRNIQIGEFVRLETNIHIGKNVTIGDCVEIGSRTVLEDDTTIAKNIKIGGHFRLRKGQSITRQIRIVGSKNLVIYLGFNWIKIGHNEHPIWYWLDNYRDELHINQYTEEEIEEYRKYIYFISEIHKNK